MNGPDALSQQHALQVFAETIAGKASAFTDDIEVLVLRRDTLSFSLLNGQLVPELKVGRLQVGLRALRGGRLAMAATTSFDVDENLSALKAALPAARPTSLVSFASPGVRAAESGIDEGLQRFFLEPARLQALAVEMRARTLEAMKNAPHVETFEGRLGVSTSWTAMATRNGSGAFVDDGLGASIEVNSLRSEEEYALTLDGLEAIRDLGARAVRSLPKSRISPADLGIRAGDEVDALIAPSLLEAFIRYPAQDKFLASSLESGQTTLKSGDRLAAEGITLIDTGTPAELWRPFDHELVEKKDVALIEDGRFGSFVTSRTSALKSGLPLTGNGLRSPILAEDVSEAPVRDRLTGLSMLPGTRSVDALRSSISLGILPRMVLGIHGADRARTRFSCTVADGVAIRDGKIIGQLAPGQWNLSGRVLPGEQESGLLESAEASSERTNTGSALMPHLKTRLGL